MRGYVEGGIVYPINPRFKRPPAAQVVDRPRKEGTMNETRQTEQFLLEEILREQKKTNKLLEQLVAAQGQQATNNYFEKG